MAKQQAYTYESVLKDITKHIFHPIYFLHGEEPYYSDQIADMIEKYAIPEDQKEWNQHILYGKDIDIINLVSYVKRFPMMGDKQLIIVKEAQDIKYFNAKEKEEDDDKKKSSKQADPFINYIENPSPSTILVIVFKHKKFDQRLKIATTLKKNSVLLEFKKLNDSKIPAWIVQYLAKSAYKINNKASYLIAESLGNDLSKIANELDKLKINVPIERDIDVNDVQDYIGISKDFNIFELQNALGEKNILKCNRIVNYFAANPKNNPMVLVISSLFSYFTKLLLIHSSNEKSSEKLIGILKVPLYYVDQYISASKNYSFPKLVKIVSHIRECDLKSKGVDSVEGGSGELMKELVYHILH